MNPNQTSTEIGPSTNKSAEPTLESPLIIRSPLKGDTTEFDPSPLVALLGKPSRYESAVLISVRRLTHAETVDTDWGPAFADPATHVVATGWVIDSEGTPTTVGKPYPLLNAEFNKREPSPHALPDGTVLLKKPGETEFWHVPGEYNKKIHVFSPESAPDAPQIAEVGKIIAFTKTGAWITKWDPLKFREIVS